MRVKADVARGTVAVAVALAGRGDGCGLPWVGSELPEYEEC